MIFFLLLQTFLNFPIFEKILLFQSRGWRTHTVQPLPQPQTRSILIAQPLPNSSGLCHSVPVPTVRRKAGLLTHTLQVTGNRTSCPEGSQRLRCQEAEQRAFSSGLAKEVARNWGSPCPQTSTRFNHAPGERPEGPAPATPLFLFTGVTGPAGSWIPVPLTTRTLFSQQTQDCEFPQGPPPQTSDWHQRH